MKSRLRLPESLSHIAIPVLLLSGVAGLGFWTKSQREIYAASPAGKIEYNMARGALTCYACLKPCENLTTLQVIHPVDTIDWRRAMAVKVGDCSCLDTVDGAEKAFVTWRQLKTVSHPHTQQAKDFNERLSQMRLDKGYYAKKL